MGNIDKNKEKIDFLRAVSSRIDTVFFSLETATRKTKNPEEKLTFSVIKEISENYFDLELNSEIKVRKSRGIDYLGFGAMFEPDFQFSKNPVLFTDEFKAAVLLFVDAGEDGDPKIDLLVMKALFIAGRMVARMEQEGKKRSDIPVKAGSSSWKNKVSKQDVIEMLYRIDTNGKSKNSICEAVRDALISQEAKRGEKKKDVYSVKQIGRILKEELAKIS